SVADEIRPTAVPRPRFIDLDPAYGLPTRAARLDALIRAVVRDQRWHSADSPSMQALASSAGIRQAPAPNPSLRRDAVRRLDLLWDLSVFQLIRASSSSAGNDVHVDLEFTLTEGIPSADRSDLGTATVFHGVCDLVFRDLGGRWHLVLVADTHVCPARS